MNTLIIYDSTGYVISQMAGSVREPQGGVQFLWAEIPEGKKLKNGVGIDVSANPHQAILEDMPKTEIELLKEQLALTQKAVDDLLFAGGAI